MIFIYLWIVFSLFSLNQAIIKHDLGYLAHGFALFDALVFAKVMLVAEDLNLGNRFHNRPLIYPVLYKTMLFSLLFIVFHILEEMIAALWRGSRVAESFPEVGGSAFIGAVCVWGILSISLIPFFALREIAQAMGSANCGTCSSAAERWPPPASPSDRMSRTRCRPRMTRSGRDRPLPRREPEAAAG